MPAQELALMNLMQALKREPNIDQKVRLMAEFRECFPPALSQQLDRTMLENIQSSHNDKLAIQEKIGALEEIVTELTSPPNYPGIFLEMVETPSGPLALVADGTSRFAVGLGEEMEFEELAPGDEIYLSAKRNFISARGSRDGATCGEVAEFVHRESADRLVLKMRGEEIRVRVGADLRQTKLKKGDLIQWDRSGWIALGKVARPRGENFFLEDTPRETFASIGGLGAQIQRLKKRIEMSWKHPEVAAAFQTERSRSIMLVGTPGNGKTMIARAFANYMASLSRTGCSRFMNIKPSAMNSMWFGESESNYREIFRVAREAGAEEPDIPVVIFFDEVDSIGVARGSQMGRVSDRVMQSFMAELDGLEARGNILVVSATNRVDVLDTGLTRPGRLGDIVIHVPRPTMAAAGEIFACHLRPGIPLEHANGNAEAARRELIGAAVSRIYAPGGGELANVVLRGGQQRVVRPADLVSGAVIANIVRTATERAAIRYMDVGRGGLALGDLLHAMEEQFEASARALTPANCRNYLNDLPDDAEVVRVERAARRTPNPEALLVA